jgi:hypothetical protein
MALFMYLSEKALNGPDAAEARIAIDNGKSAINSRDWHKLVGACMALIKLVPQSQHAPIPASVLSHVA